MRRSNMFFNITSNKGNTLQQFSCANFGVKNSRKKKPIIRYDMAYAFGQKLKLSKIDKVNLCFTNRTRGYKRILVAFRRTKIKIKSIKKANFKSHNGCPIKSKRRVGRGRKKRISRGRYRLIRYKKAYAINKTMADLKIQLKTKERYSNTLKFRAIDRGPDPKKLLGPTTTKKLVEFRPYFIQFKRRKLKHKMRKLNKKLSAILLTTKNKQAYQRIHKTLYYIKQRPNKFRKTIKRFAIRWKGRWRILRNFINKIPPRGIFLRFEKQKLLARLAAIEKVKKKRFLKNMVKKIRKLKKIKKIRINNKIKKKMRKLLLRTKTKHLIKLQKKNLIFLKKRKIEQKHKKNRAKTQKKSSKNTKKIEQKHKKNRAKTFFRNSFIVNMHDKDLTREVKYRSLKRKRVLRRYKKRLKRLKFYKYKRRMYFKKLLNFKDIKKIHLTKCQRMWASYLRIKKVKQLNQKVKSSISLKPEKGHLMEIDHKRYQMLEKPRAWLPLKRYREERRKWWRERRRVRRRIRREEEKRRKQRLLSRKTTGNSWKIANEKTKKVSG